MMPRKGSKIKDVVDDGLQQAGNPEYYEFDLQDMLWETAGQYDGEERATASAPSSGSDEDSIDSPVRLRSKRKSKSTSPSKRPLLVNDNIDHRKKAPPNLGTVQDSSTRRTILLGVRFMIITLMLFLVGVIYVAVEKGLMGKIHASRMPIFEKKLEKLKELFPSQPAHNWGTIRSAFAEVLNSSSYAYGPATLIILASRKDQHLATCFSEKLALSLAKTFYQNEEPIILNGAKLRNSKDSVAAKHTIDSSVKGKDNFVMQFNSLEQIDSYTASIFHSLCDYYNSPFKERAIFIFTVHTSEDVEGRLRKEYDEMADRVLNDAWDDLDINKRSALLARLTGSTILLRRESRRVC